MRILGWNIGSSCVFFVVGFSKRSVVRGDDGWGGFIGVVIFFGFFGFGSLLDSIFGSVVVYRGFFDDRMVDILSFCEKIMVFVMSGREGDGFFDCEGC